jgi:thiol-disulfide isomerase/thioredoxin
MLLRINLYALLTLPWLGCSATPSGEPQAAGTAAASDTIPFPVYLRFEDFQPHLQQDNDTTYVLNFWATWCQPCISEMPYFEKLIAEKAGQPVRIWLVSMDFPKDIKGKLIPFVLQRNLAPQVLSLADMDYNAWIDRVSPEWDGAIPFTLVYKGEKRLVKSGELESYEELTGLLQQVGGQ